MLVIDLDLIICTNTSSILELTHNAHIDNFPKESCSCTLKAFFCLNELCYGTGGFKEHGKSGVDRKWWLFLHGVTMVSVLLQCICNLMNRGLLVQCMDNVKKTASNGAVEQISKN